MIKLRHLAVLAAFAASLCSNLALAEDAREKDVAAINAMLAHMSESWNQKSGAAFARDFTDDAIFTVWFGFQMTGPEEIAAGHQIIFDGIYAGTDATFAANKIRFLDADTALVHIDGYLFDAGGAAAEGPPGFVPLMVVQHGEDGWKIEAFQNTQLDLSNMKGGKDIRENEGK